MNEDEAQSSLGHHASSSSEASSSPTSSLSRRISDMIEEAFPVSVVSSAVCESETSPTPSNSCVEISSPPAYTPFERLPQYTDDGSLAERLACPNMQEAFAISVTYHRVPMIAPLPNHPYKTHHDLMLLAPSMPFKRFLRELEEKATAHILAERPSSRRLLAQEKVVFTPVFKRRVGGDGQRFLLKRSHVVKSVVTEQNWSAAVAMLQKGASGAELKVKFWTERPGSAEEVLRKERMAFGYVHISSTTTDEVLGECGVSGSSREGAVMGHFVRV